jgi:hypothetical protein
MSASPEMLKAAADAKLRRALELIERAQNDLASACAELSGLEGGIATWKATNQLHDRVRKLWYRAEKFRRVGRYKLDQMNRDAIARREAAKQTADA